MCQPYLVAGVELCRNRGKTDRQIVDAAVLQSALKLAREVAATDKARAGKADIEIAQHPTHGESARPALQIVHFLRGVTTANHSADGRANDHVRRMPCASNVRMTPICAKPRAAPPPSARPIVGRIGVGCGCVVASASRSPVRVRANNPSKTKTDFS